jgi:hypothetical protein
MPADIDIDTTIDANVDTNDCIVVMYLINRVCFIL